MGRVRTQKVQSNEPSYVGQTVLENKSKSKFFSCKDLQAKYFPRGSIQDCSPKPHQSWVWRNIIKFDNPKLKEGRWWVGKGNNIPLRHQDWFRSQPHNLNNPILTSGTVADLINQQTYNWRVDLVRDSYPCPLCNEILQIPLPKTNSVCDKLLWKHSNSGEFEVKIAYRILLEDYLAPSSEQHKLPHVENKIWKLIWKLKTPQKICNFVWKLMHDSLPTRQLLRNSGIIDIGLCPLCNCEEESTSHLFLQCPFAKACWHGLPLIVHTSDLIGISVQQWLRELIVSHNLDDEVFMEYMQNIFITLWTIWTHRNMVVHEEKQSNPMEVVLIVQNLYCRYKEAFSIHHGSNNSYSRTRIEQT